MKGRVKAAGSLSRGLQASNLQPIWITDALLADAYNRFARQHRRHGSNVPGPLEARRRASKRKNTNWAHLPRGLHPIEPTILFGNQSPTGWWQKEQRQLPEKAPAPSLLPWWLLPPAPKPTPEVTPLEQASPSVRTTNESSPQPCSPTLGLTASARQCKTVQDIHKMVHERGMDLRQNPDATHVMLGEAVACQWPVKDIADFLVDPLLNPPCMKHCSHFLRRLRQSLHGKWDTPTERRQHKRRPGLAEYCLLPDNWKLLQTAFCRAANLGLIDSKELQELINETYALEGGKMDLETCHHVVLELLLSFEQSSVCRIQDLDHIWTSKLVADLLAKPLSDATLRLLLVLKGEHDIKSILVSSMKAVFDSTTRLVLSNAPILPASLQEERSPIDAISNSFPSHLGARSKLSSTTIFSVIPIPITALALAKATADYLSEIRSGRLDPQNMARWGHFISSLEIPGLSSWLIHKANFMAFRGSLSDLLGQRDGYLVAIWLLLKVCRPYEPGSAISFPDITTQLSLTEEMKILFPLASGIPTNSLQHIRLAIQALPFEGAFLQQLYLLSGHKVSQDTKSQVRSPTMTGDGFMAPIMHAEMNVELPSLMVGEAVRVTQPDVELPFQNFMDDKWYRSMRWASPETLTELGDSINADLPKFILLARRIVHGDKYAFRVVKRLLKNNTSLKLSISQSWPQRVEYLELCNSLPQLPSSTDLTDEDKDHHPEPVQALEVIERLALAFAVTSLLSHRTALLQVQWCHVYLLQHQAPITPAISHALWHAGVIRYKGKGPAYTQLKWVLKVVAEVEGIGVARMLLWNSQFRKDREVLLRDLETDGQDGDVSPVRVSRYVPRHNQKIVSLNNRTLKGGRGSDKERRKPVPWET